MIRVSPNPGKYPITLEGETVLITETVAVPNSPYYRGHIEAGNLLLEEELKDGSTGEGTGSDPEGSQPDGSPEGDSGSEAGK